MAFLSHKLAGAVVAIVIILMLIAVTYIKGRNDQSVSNITDRIDGIQKAREIEKDAKGLSEGDISDAIRKWLRD